MHHIVAYGRWSETIVAKKLHRRKKRGDGARNNVGNSYPGLRPILPHADQGSTEGGGQREVDKGGLNRWGAQRWVDRAISIAGPAGPVVAPFVFAVAPGQHVAV